jgi:predicted DNA-binding protein
MGYTDFVVKMKQTAIRIPATDLTRLVGLAKKEGLSASDLIRRAIREYLERGKK